MALLSFVAPSSTGPRWYGFRQGGGRKATLFQNYGRGVMVGGVASLPENAAGAFKDSYLLYFSTSLIFTWKQICKMRC